jgi:PPOX class probable F420-dependent enzyme
VDRRVESRLKKESVVWLVTAGKDCRPQAVPVWFLWDGGSFLIYAQHGTKVNHIRANPYVELHLNEIDDDIVRASGRVTLATKPAAHTVPEYVRKYGSQIKGFGWTNEEFSRRYPNVIRVRNPRFH